MALVGGFALKGVVWCGAGRCDGWDVDRDGWCGMVGWVSLFDV